MIEFSHEPVLARECVEYLNIVPNGTYVDGTVGGAGHASLILASLNGFGCLIGIDRDDKAVSVSTARLSEINSKSVVHVVRSNFVDIEKVCQDLNVTAVDGILLDLGVSSHQFDSADRGFSYQQDAPLDMRMDRQESLTAAGIVNQYREEDLVRILRTYGEERWASRIAKFIVTARAGKYIETTGELVEIIKAAVPKAARRDGPHPARRTFQAIRIAVNDEIEKLEPAIRSCVRMLASGGRLCVISFHSLEDRIVKSVFSDMAKDCICPPELPVCTCEHRAIVKRVTTKPILPTSEEIERNPRARSAKLRVAEKL